jgi:HAD superfamily hydrolase (TIGR01548 family)
MFGAAAGDGLDRCVRITCPCDEVGLRRVCDGLRSVLRPEALLLDMDGVIADVSGSYRRAIVLTAAHFGVEITGAEIASVKAAGNANNDWVLTKRLMERKGVRAGLDEVTRVFEGLYQGTAETPGLEASERLLVSRDVLAAIRARVKLAVVTGRPRSDCMRFLRRHGLESLFASVVCMEDGPAKPEPDVVRLAMSQLGATSAWMVGDTPDDVVAARRAGVVPLGVPAPGDDKARARETLEQAGAAVVLGSLEELGRMLP